MGLENSKIFLIVGGKTCLPGKYLPPEKEKMLGYLMA
jgi:hypothetical protein